MTTETLMVRAFERGLSLRDFEVLEVGMILDYIVTYNNLQEQDNEPQESVRMATQADFDKF